MLLCRASVSSQPEEKGVSAGEGASLGTRVLSCLFGVTFSTCQVQTVVLGSKLEVLPVFLWDSKL